MIKTIAAAAIITAASAGFAVAGPTDFYATPMNHGAPTNLPGETIIPGMSQAMTVVNTVTQPILQPLLAPGGDKMAAAEPAEPMHMRRGHRHRMMRHHMSHRKMMMHKRMMHKQM